MRQFFLVRLQIIQGVSSLVKLHAASLFIGYQSISSFEITPNNQSYCKQQEKAGQQGEIAQGLQIEPIRDIVYMQRNLFELCTVRIRVLL